MRLLVFLQIIGVVLSITNMDNGTDFFVIENFEFPEGTNVTNQTDLFYVFGLESRHNVSNSTELPFSAIFNGSTSSE